MTVALKKKTGPSGAEVPIASTTSGGRRILVCAACKVPVTSTKERLAVEGGHEHTFANPHGLVFHIGCFASAPGVRLSGPRSSDFSWFKGYDWQLAHCRACHTHLGWGFGQSGVTLFYGLVLARLAEAEEES